jgi:membrane protease YdiL (CAAX protease family)
MLLHFKLAPYPEPLPRSEKPWREFLEALVFWAIQVIFVLVFIYVIPPSDLTNVTPRLALTRSLLGLILEVAIPALFVILVTRWTLKDLGFSRPKAPHVALFGLILFGVGGGVLPLMGLYIPMPLWMVAYSLYQPAFFEELFFCGILQGKLERALGQNRAWIFSGILLGLAHLSVNLIGPLWTGSIPAALLLLLKQTISGWIFGIIYMKTRSLLPSMVAHFVADGRLATILYLLFF